MYEYLRELSSKPIRYMAKKDLYTGFVNKLHSNDDSLKKLLEISKNFQSLLHIFQICVKLYIVQKARGSYRSPFFGSMIVGSIIVGSISRSFKVFWTTDGKRDLCLPLSRETAMCSASYFYT